eukprot:144291-Amphidinium_carterae.1
MSFDEVLRQRERERDKTSAAGTWTEQGLTLRFRNSIKTPNFIFLGVLIGLGDLKAYLVWIADDGHRISTNDHLWTRWLDKLTTKEHPQNRRDHGELLVTPTQERRGEHVLGS